MPIADAAEDTIDLDVHEFLVSSGIMWGSIVRPAFNARIRSILTEYCIEVRSIRHDRHPLVVLKLIRPPWLDLHLCFPLLRRFHQLFKQAGHSVRAGRLRVVIDDLRVHVYATPDWRL